jgi:hypothetical protein
MEFWSIIRGFYYIVVVTAASCKWFSLLMDVYVISYFDSRDLYID